MIVGYLIALLGRKKKDAGKGEDKSKKKA